MARLAPIVLPALAAAGVGLPHAAASTPLNDLGTGLYLNQFQGGLYPGGSNVEPAAHAAEGLVRAAAMTPLNTLGQPDPNGKYVFLSVGMSNTTQEFCSPNNTSTDYTPWSFMGQAAAHPAVNHSTMVLFNGARGGQSASTWDQFNDSNYTRVANDLQTNGLSEAQVRVAWLKVANPGPTVSMPAGNSDANALVAQMGNIVRAMKQHYHNLQTVFVSSRIYAGYATTTLNPEPYAYESGFAVKRLIEAQITQTGGGAIDPLAGNLDFTSGVAPWITWGPYMWADGLNPRSDGLTWAQNEFVSDGTHPSQLGQQKVGTMLVRHMITSPFAQRWFLSTLPGDANVDHVVNVSDFSILASNFGATNRSWSQGDFDYDGRVNVNDFTTLASNFGLSATGLNGTVTPQDWANLAAAVPEPTTSLLLTGLAASRAIHRRRRRTDPSRTT